jgi:uncharacterized protein YecE (DUF72 family)
MGEITVGTASWTDRTLLESGWYPRTADTPEKRLAHYAKQFPLVEVDATYYAPPAERTAELWVQRTPVHFTFNIKAFSLLTGHPTRVTALYQDLRPQTDKANIYPGDLQPRAYEEVWTRFLSALDPLVRARKLGALLFQFPPWFTIRRANKQYLLEVQKRCRPLRAVFEFRHASWFEGGNRDETVDFLQQHRMPLVCVDMPQGHVRRSRRFWPPPPTSLSCVSTGAVASGRAMTSTRSSAISIPIGNSWTGYPSCAGWRTKPTGPRC